MLLWIFSIHYQHLSMYLFLTNKSTQYILKNKAAPVRMSVTLEDLDAINVDQSTKENFEKLNSQLEGLNGFMEKLGISPAGLNNEQVKQHREKFGENVFPEPPEKTWLFLFYQAVFEDLVVVILCIAALVSFIIGLIEDPGHGWIEGVAITIAVLLVGT